MTECIVVMDDQEVKIQHIEEEEIAPMLDSGFVCAVLKIVNGEIRYAVVDWDEYKLIGWKKPELDVTQK